MPYEGHECLPKRPNPNPEKIRNEAMRKDFVTWYVEFCRVIATPDMKLLRYIGNLNILKLKCSRLWNVILVTTWLIQCLTALTGSLRQFDVSRRMAFTALLNCNSWLLSDEAVTILWIYKQCMIGVLEIGGNETRRRVIFLSVESRPVCKMLWIPSVRLCEFWGNCPP